MKKTDETNTTNLTGYCKFCGQSSHVAAVEGEAQETLDEKATKQCGCEAAKKYTESIERTEKAKNRIAELFGPTAEKPISEETVNILFAAVDAIENKSMKGITVEIGKGSKAKVAKMAKESIKVERMETMKTTFEE